jgi:VIT1/CCC1 family predicted Fe2+/Mn2+ transporter
MEKMYINNNPYIISETMKMHDHCSHCGTKYKMEPNFFFGAMYVSYGLAVFVGIIIFVAAIFLFDAGLKASFISIFVGLLALMPWITRISRNIYINMFMHYDPNAAKKS